MKIKRAIALVIMISVLAGSFMYQPQKQIVKAEGTTGTTGTTTDTTVSQNTEIQKNQATTERNAMWISYLDFKQGRKTVSQFTSKVRTMFDNCVACGMNVVVVQVRPNGDAMYPSKYFPWAKNVSGKQGRSVSYDPMAIMVEEAHKRNLKIEAWINPYRVSNDSTSYAKLSKDNQARKWHATKSTRRNVLSYGGKLYYNPSKAAVRNLVINGVKEIVTNYEVDGIHMDDYFYPTFSKFSYKRVFDAKEYNAYVKEQKKKGASYLSIASWRRNNVNKMVKGVYSAIKEINPNVEFGISPAGNISNLKSKYSYYVDIDKWMSSDGYVDYICPQIYWDFQYGQYSYDKVLKKWEALAKKGNVKLYVGIGVYRTVPPKSGEWKKKSDVLKRQIQYARKSSSAKGFYYFRYENFLDFRNQKEIKNLLSVLK